MAAEATRGGGDARCTRAGLLIATTLSLQQSPNEGISCRATPEDEGDKVEHVTLIFGNNDQFMSP